MLDQVFDFEQRGHDTSLSSGAWMQRDQWPGLTATSGGGAATQISPTNGQRAAKRQPGGGLAMFGTMPSMVARCVGAAVEPRDRAEQADGVGMLRAGEQFVDRRALDDLAGIHHRDLVADFGDDAEIVGDQDDRGAAGRLQFAHQVEDLRLQGDVERGGRLVRDQELGIAGQRHRDHDALAHAAGELVRIVVDAPFRRGDVDAAQQLDGALARRCAASRRDGAGWSR